MVAPANDQAGSNGVGDALSSTETQRLLAKARAVAGAVPDPELPFVSVEDLGILRAVKIDGDMLVAEV